MKNTSDHCSVIRAPLAHVIRKTITVQVYDDFSKYATPNDEMIVRMLYLSPDKNKLHNKRSLHSIIKHMAEYKIDNRSVCDILDQLCKDTDLYLYVKQHKSKRNGGGAFYAIHFKWLGLSPVNATASEAKMALQMSTYYTEKKA